MPVSSCLPGLLFARRVMPQLSSVAWKSLFLWGNFSWKRAQENVNEYWKIHMAENSKRASGFIYRSSEYLIFIPEANKRDDWYMVLRAKPMLQVVFLFLGYNVCTETTWGIWKDVRHRQPVHSVHLWPSLCLSNWGCNLSCNPSHFCLCLCCLRQSPGHN